MNFNSIKVRLKLQPDINDQFEPKFQFHKGTIKTDDDESTIGRFPYFNSIKVRLKLL